MAGLRLLQNIDRFGHGLGTSHVATVEQDKPEIYVTGCKLSTNWDTFVIIW